MSFSYNTFLFFQHFILLSFILAFKFTALTVAYLILLGVLFIFKMLLENISLLSFPWMNN